MNIHDEYKAFIARAKVNGAILTSYLCHHCDEWIETLVPPKGDVWDSAVVCPHCNSLHFKVVDDSGHVSVRDLGGES